MFANIFAVATTLFVVIDVLGSIPTIIAAKQKNGGLHPLPVTLFSGFLMILFLFLGERILHILGVEVQSFALAGSIVLFLMALEMLLGRDIFKSDGKGGAGNTIVPIAFPLLTGVGTLTTILSLNGKYSKIELMAGITINLVIIFVVLNLIGWLERTMGETTLSVIKKLFGVILLAIAMQMLVSNLLAQAHM